MDRTATGQNKPGAGVFCGSLGAASKDVESYHKNGAESPPIPTRKQALTGHFGGFLATRPRPPNERLAGPIFRTPDQPPKAAFMAAVSGRSITPFSVTMA